jgi:uncharacterized protein YodC (DUF2158 family)
MEFQAGEIVQLKSGGPVMTVVSNDDQGVHCLWYGEAADEMRSATIPLVALEAAPLTDTELDEEEDEDEAHHGKGKHDDD